MHRKKKGARHGQKRKRRKERKEAKERKEGKEKTIRGFITKPNISTACAYARVRGAASWSGKNPPRPLFLLTVYEECVIFTTSQPRGHVIGDNAKMASPHPPLYANMQATAAHGRRAHGAAAGKMPLSLRQPKPLSKNLFSKTFLYRSVIP